MQGNIAFKCDRCSNFYGVASLEYQSYVLIHDSKHSHISTYDICPSCYDAIIKPLVQLLTIKTLEKPEESIVDAIIEEPKQESPTETIPEKTSETSSETKIQENSTEQ